MKISIDEEREQVILRIDGKLIRPGTEELEKAWELLAGVLASKALCVDIRNVTFIDQNGLAILGRIIKTTNTTVLADTPLTRQFVEQARQGRGNQERK